MFVLINKTRFLSEEGIILKELGSQSQVIPAEVLERGTDILEENTLCLLSVWPSIFSFHYLSFIRNSGRQEAPNFPYPFPFLLLLNKEVSLQKLSLDHCSTVLAIYLLAWEPKTKS